MTQTHPHVHTVHPSQQTSLTLSSTKNALQRAHHTLLQQLRVFTDVHVHNLTYQYPFSKYARQYLHKYYIEDTVYQSDSNIL